MSHTPGVYIPNGEPALESVRPSDTMDGPPLSEVDMNQPTRGARRCKCGALLARDNEDTRCAACKLKSRGRILTAPEVPAEFWRHESMLRALAACHMGRVIRAFRTHPYHETGAISQQTVATWAGLTQAQLSRIENGGPMLHLDRLAQWARMLRIPAGDLWFRLPCAEPTRGEFNDVNRADFLRATGLAIAGAATAPLFSAAPKNSITDQDCAQWLAWAIWTRNAQSIHETELPAPVAHFLASHTKASPGQAIVRSPSGSYTFAHRSFVDFYVAQRIFGGITAGDNELFAASQTSHETDLVLREFVLRDRPSAKNLTHWIKQSPSPVLRVNCAGVLAKLASPRFDDDVVRTLKSDVSTRRLYVTAVASRVLQLPWGEASQLADSVEQEPKRLLGRLSRDRAGYLVNRLASEIGNPRDSAARWCSIVVLDQLQHAAPEIASDALHTALRNESRAESLRSIGAVLSGDSPLSY